MKIEVYINKQLGRILLWNSKFPFNWKSYPDFLHIYTTNHNETWDSCLKEINERYFNAYLN